MDIAKTIQEKFPQWFISGSEALDQETITLKAEGIKEICQFLRDQLRFDFLMDLSCIDYLRHPDYRTKPERFEVLYNLYSLENKNRVFLKVPTAEQKPIVPSLTSLWAAADWYEREVWDMFGVRFDGHPDLKRILMYEEFQGHPLRKDYPLTKRQPLIGPVN